MASYASTRSGLTAKGMPADVGLASRPSEQAEAPHQHSTGTDIAPKERKQTVLETHGYFLDKVIGNGSYATVKVAKSTRHSRNVAVKIISKFSAPADYLKKFLPREIEVVKGLKHPNLIRFLQAIETTHRVYIIMEFAENGSLLDVIRRDLHIDEKRSRKWLRQLVDAVEYCHDRGIVHRDIKCENMLMDNAFNVKLSDFGFARGQMKNKNGQFVHSETFCGSYAYASPEILRGIPYQPNMSDVWSMGVVLFAMVYGRLPFDDTNYNTLLKQVSNKVVFPKEPRILEPCKALILKILSPLKTRIKITGIRQDPWFMISNESMLAQAVTADLPIITVKAAVYRGGSKYWTVSTSQSASSVDDDVPTTGSSSLAKRENEAAPTTTKPLDQLLTKEKIGSKSHKSEARRESTDQEEPLQSMSPTGSNHA